MANESTVSPFLVALKGQLATRLAGNPTWSKSVVYLQTPQDERTLNDCIILWRGVINSVQVYVSNLRHRDETVQIPGLLQAFASDQDADKAALAALARAQLLLDEIVAELRDNPPPLPATVTQNRVAKVVDARWLPVVPDAGGQICRCRFTTEYTARVH